MTEYIRVKLPDGTYGRMPANMTEEQRQQALKSFNERKEPIIAKEPKKPQSLPDMMKRYFVQEPAASLGQFGHHILNVPSKAAHLVGAKGAGNELAYRPGYDYRQAVGLPEEQNFASQAIGIAPEILAGIAMPGANLGKLGQAVSQIPKAGKYLQSMLSQAVPQAGLAAAMSDPSRMLEAGGIAGGTQAGFTGLEQLALSPKPKLQKLFSTLLGGAAGLGTGYALNQMGVGDIPSTVGGALAGGLAKKGVGTKAMMMAEQAGGKNLPLAQERLKMAEDIGLDFLTPEEAFNSPFLATKQGSLGRTPEGSELMYEKFQKRNESEQNAVNKLLKNIHDPEIMGPEAEKLYALANPEKFTPSFGLEDEVINEAMKNVGTKAAYKKKLKNVPENTIEYWDLIKENLYDSESALRRSGHDREAAVYADTRKKLVNEMDEVNSYINEKGEKTSNYKEARGLEERKFVRKELEQAFDKTNINSGHAFFKALNSKEEFADILKHLRNAPEAQEKLKKMRELFKDFRKESTTNKVRGLTQGGIKQDRNLGNYVQTAIDKMFAGKFDKEAIEFITSKDWDKQLAEINKISDKQKQAAKVIEVFGKIAAQTNAKKEPFLETKSGYEVYY